MKLCNAPAQIFEFDSSAKRYKIQRRQIKLLFILCVMPRLAQSASDVLEELTIWLGAHGAGGWKPPVSGGDSLGQKIKNVMKRILPAMESNRMSSRTAERGLRERGPLGVGWVLNLQFAARVRIGHWFIFTSLMFPRII